MDIPLREGIMLTVENLTPCGVPVTPTTSWWVVTTIVGLALTLGEMSSRPGVLIVLIQH